MTKLRNEIEFAINSCSAENGSDTPDFILAEYLTDCLAAFDRAVTAREKWYGRNAVVVDDDEDEDDDRDDFLRQMDEEAHMGWESHTFGDN